LKTCVNCYEDTNSTFYIKKFNGCICGNCVSEYVNFKKIEIQAKIKKLQESINICENEIEEYDKLVVKTKLEDCKHENIISTGFCKYSNDKKLMKEFVCQDCGEKVYKYKMSLEDLKQKMCASK
jgi:hypothetical protein